MQERHHRAIDTDHELVRCGHGQRVGLEDLFRRLRLERDGGCTRSLSDPARAGAVDINLCPEGKLERRFAERGNVRTQPHQAFLQAGRELARQQSQFVIEGEKARWRTLRLRDAL